MFRLKICCSSCFEFRDKEQYNHRSSALSNKYLSNNKTLSKKTPRSLISRDESSWKVKMTMKIRLNSDVLWLQSNIVSVNERGCGRWNEWDKLRAKGNKMKYDRWKIVEITRLTLLFVFSIFSLHFVTYQKSWKYKVFKRF